MIGATGATGKEIVEFAKQNQHIEELILVVRRKLEEWTESDF